MQVFDIHGADKNSIVLANGISGGQNEELLPPFSANDFLFSLSSKAHHDIPGEVDIDSPITITGKVIGVEWKNPHSALLIDADPINGGVKKLWSVQIDTPSALLRRGLNRQSFSAMSQVSLVIYTSTDTSCVKCSAYGLNITDSLSWTYLLNQQLQSSLTELNFGQ